MESKAWKLEKFARFEKDAWNQIDNNTTDLVLLVVGLQLFITQRNTALESIALSAGSGALRGLWKNSTLIIVLSCPTQTRKLRIKFAATKECSDEMNCRTCVQFLQSFMPIRDVQVPNKQSKVKLTEVYSCMMDDKLTDPVKIPTPSTFPTSFPLDLAIRTCILDPGFPDLVRQVDMYLKQL